MKYANKIGYTIEASQIDMLHERLLLDDGDLLSFVVKVDLENPVDLREYETKLVKNHLVIFERIYRELD